MFSLLLLLNSSVPGAIVAQSGITVGAAANLSMPAPVSASAGLRFGTLADLAPPGLRSAAGLSVSASASLTAPVRFQASAGIRFSTVTSVAAKLEGAGAITFGAVARLNASPRESSAGITLGGVDISGRLRKALTIRDVLNDAPNTATVKLEGGAMPGEVLRVTLNDGNTQLFAGTLQQVGTTYEGGKPALPIWNCQATDRVPKRRPFGTWVGVSASVVAAEIAAGFAPGFTTRIQAGLPEVSIIFDGSEPFLAALVRLANLVGGYAKIDDGEIAIVLVDDLNPPDPLDLGHRPLNEPPITRTEDVSQLRTRVYGKGYGENVPTDVAALETIVPVAIGAEFNPLGGRALAGTRADGAQSQQIAYTGVSRPVGGTLVGTGASPSNAPALDLAPGAGVDTGVHDVTVVYVTALGRSRPGPAASIDVGFLQAPAAAPVAGVPTIGAGVTNGAHSVAVSFVTAAGETPASPLSNEVVAGPITSGLIPPPVAGPTLSLGAGSGQTASSNVYYAVTFSNAVGQTTPGPSSSINVPGFSGQTGAGLQPESLGSGSIAAGNYAWWGSVVTADGESEITDIGGYAAGGPFNMRLTFSSPSANSPFILAYRFYRKNAGGPALYVGQTASTDATSFLDNKPVGSEGAAGPTVNRTYRPVNLSNIPIGPAGTTGRRVYASTAWPGSSALKLLASINNNTTTTATDSEPGDASRLGADAPTVNTTSSTNPYNVIPVTGLPIGGPLVTARKLWMTPAGGGPLKLAATIGITGTTATITTADGALGVSPPAVSSAAANQIAVSAIPKGSNAVTARELYMSLVPGGGRRLALVIPDNVTVTATLAIGNASLAGQPAEPVSDTSGLTQPVGQVNPGADTLPLASIEPFLTAGGWIDLGHQLIRYTGLIGQAATGIPATGPGALVTTVLYGQQATPAPVLLGVTGLALPMAKGAAVHIFIQRDDLEAQAAEAARSGGDGVVEYLLSDGRRGEVSLGLRCDAELALFSRPLVTVTYATRDTKTKSGKSIVINLPGQVQETLTIQEVTITEIDIAPRTMPRFSVSASSVRFSLENMLRRLGQPQ